MVSTTVAVVIALLALVLGIGIGGLLWRSFGPHQHRSRDLEQRLAEAEQRLSDYQAEVTEHFVETSRRVNELTRNYKDVHEYLASSAVKLTTPSVGREMRAQLDWSASEGDPSRPIESNEEGSDDPSLNTEPEPSRRNEGL